MPNPKASGGAAPGRGYFDPAPGFAGAADGAVAGEPVLEPVDVAGFVELLFVVGALVWLDAVVWLSEL